jgi:hypothetical protein
MLIGALALKYGGEFVPQIGLAALGTIGISAAGYGLYTYLYDTGCS